MIIIATIGQHTTEDKIRKIILTGADIVRFNLSRHSLEENISFINLAQKIIWDLNAKTKIMLDMPINKIRLGDFNIKFFAVRENEEFICKTGSYTDDCNQFIPIQTTKLGEKVHLNQMITIGDGEIAVQVTEIIDSETIKIKILNNGIIQYHRTFNIKYQIPDDIIIDSYRDILTKINASDTNYRPEFFAISYINKQANEIIKSWPDIKGEGSERKIIVKIENESAVDDLEQIFQDDFYDMIMLDRGELGVNLPFQKLGLLQKKMSTISKKYNKPLIISTQILESTINNCTPNRSDILDLTNLVLDDVFGIMLCKETGFNSRPAYSISVAKKIIAEVEKYKQHICLQPKIST
ncbi:MAG: pyruvate kinase [Candidatus Magasanikbacteria bacterium]